ncbi:M48 family metalloprotease [Verticiella sediminum]|nr:M48 family metalloprotease [Verticiella sediminum]
MRAPVITRLRRCVVALLVPALLVGAAPARAQPAGLPDLGDTAAVELSPRLEQRLGEAIMADGRRDPTYVDDPAIRQYLTTLGRDLAARGSGVASVEVFAIRDPSINAFAMPGGYIGIHSGLVLSTQNESELAGVVAHEIGHVGQRHVARRMAQQNQSSMLLLGMMAAALAAAAAGAGDLAQGAAVFGQAAAVNSQLSFSRDAEREADRVGLQMMTAAGFDPAGMSSMFGRMAQSGRFNTGAGPSYASTHPMSIERMSDMQNLSRASAVQAPRQSDTYWFVRAKLAVLQSGYSRAADPVGMLRAEASSHSGARAAAAHYGVAYGLLQRRDPAGARAAWQQAVAEGVQHPMLDQLGAELDLAENNVAAATQHAQAGAARWPQDRALAITEARMLQRAGRDAEAVQKLEPRLEQWGSDEPVLYRMAAESLARLGDPVREKRYMAEYYALVGALPASLIQLQQARAATHEFHEQSVLDARIAETKRRIEDDRAFTQKFER